MGHEFHPVPEKWALCGGTTASGPSNDSVVVYWIEETSQSTQSWLVFLVSLVVFICGCFAYKTLFSIPEVHITNIITMDSSGAAFAPMGDEQQQPGTTTAPMTATATAPIVELAPIQDTTTTPVTAFGGTQNKTHIEGMEALDRKNSDDPENAISAEELSFYSASENAQGDDNIWGLLSGVGGNIYEW